MSSEATHTIQPKKSSVIDLGGEPAVARRHRFPGPKAQIQTGKKSGEKASRGAPQTMPQRAWLFSTAHVEGWKDERFSITRRGKRFQSQERNLKKVAWTAGTPAHGSRAGENQLVQTRWLSPEIERGTAARGVPVRQKRVAEPDDDVAVRFSEATRRKRNVIGAFASHQIRRRTSRGRGLSSVWQLE